MPREYYSASDAARMLGISLDTLRRWDSQGRIKTRRDASNRRTVSAKEIERLRGGARAEHQVSARNRFSGTVREVKVEGLMAQVEVVVTEPAVLTAIVTADSAKELGIKRGDSIVAVIKATSVMVER
jgi:molybdopterin-binding protein